MNADVELLAVTGILRSQPGLAPSEVRYELAKRRYGQRPADEAYRHRPESTPRSTSSPFL